MALTFVHSVCTDWWLLKIIDHLELDTSVQVFLIICICYKIFVHVIHVIVCKWISEQNWGVQWRWQTRKSNGNPIKISECCSLFLITRKIGFLINVFIKLEYELCYCHSIDLITLHNTQYHVSVTNILFTMWLYFLKLKLFLWCPPQFFVSVYIHF
jgi:hypothetical protein